MKPSEQAKAAAAWWHGLQPNASGRGGDRAALARLRRADLWALMDDPETFALFRSLKRTKPQELTDVALCAGVLACVRENDVQPPARTLGAAPGEPPEAAALKPLRFRRLIEAEAPEERLALLRRAAQLAGRRLNVAGLAYACLNWSDDTRRRWIFDYYNAGAAAPTADPNETVAKDTAA